MRNDFHRQLSAAFAIVVVVCLAVMLASERTLPLTAEAWLMMLSMFLWPIVVCRIADREFIWWGIATNLIAFSTWFITAYWLAAAWRRLGDDAPTLVVVL